MRNNATHGAAGIDIIDCSLTSTGNIHFVNNTNTYFLGYSNFFGPPAAVWASASSLHFTGTNNFIGNSANTGIAGAIAVTNTSLSFTGSSNFNCNSGFFGGAIYAECDSVLSFSGTNTFIGNSAESCGSAIIVSGSKSVNFTGTNVFNNNSAAYYGGAIAALPSLPAFQFFCVVIDIYTVVDLTGTNNFSSNSAVYGGAICTFENISLSLSGTSNINSNNGVGGGAIYAVNAILKLNGIVSFTNNEVHNSSVGSDTGGGAICVINTILTLNGTVSFTNNQANIGSGTGGGVYLRTSTLSILSNNCVLGKQLRISWRSHLYQITLEVALFQICQPSPFYQTQPCIGRTIMPRLEELSMLMIALTHSSTALRLRNVHRMNASSNSMTTICPVVLIPNLFSRTTLLMLQEVCYMVVQ